MLALSLSIALALFFYLSLSVLALKKIQGEEVKRRLETFREEEKPQEAEDNPNDLKKIPLYQRTIGRLLAQAMDSRDTPLRPFFVLRLMPPPSV